MPTILADSRKLNAIKVVNGTKDKTQRKLLDKEVECNCTLATNSRPKTYEFMNFFVSHPQMRCL